jgi:hypothetical protein
MPAVLTRLLVSRERFSDFPGGPQPDIGFGVADATGSGSSRQTLDERFVGRVAVTGAGAVKFNCAG